VRARVKLWSGAAWRGFPRAAKKNEMLNAVTRNRTPNMQKQVRKAVFPAAGLGTRFLPATKASPKEMLPLVDKPLIQYVVEEAVASGIQSIIIVTGRDKSAIEDHFDISFELEHLLRSRGKNDVLKQVRAIPEMARFGYVRQREALGLGHAILQARDFVEDEPFAVMLSDDIVDSETPALRQMLDVYEKYDAPVIATMQVDGEAISRFGVIDADEVEPGVFKINDMVEKPSVETAPSNLAIIGRYILTPDIFDEIESTQPGAGGEIQITDAMRSLLKKRPFYALRLQGTRHDAGDKLGFLIATVEFALKRPDLAPEFLTYLRSLQL
jgi:UTP--glucose-1-phosphate uridylyltransferase